MMEVGLQKEILKKKILPTDTILYFVWNLKYTFFFWPYFWHTCSKNFSNATELMDQDSNEWSIGSHTWGLINFWLTRSMTSVEYVFYREMNTNGSDYIVRK